MIKNLKSTKYPKQDFNATLEFVKKLDENYSQRLISYKEVEKILGLKTNATTKFSKNVSTAAQFGLIDLNAGTVRITKNGMLILHPVDDNIQKLKIQAFLNSPLYSNLIDRFKNDSLPTVETLSNILLNEYGIIKTMKLPAAKYFLQGLNQLEMQKDGKIDVSVLSGFIKMSDEETLEDINSDNVRNAKETVVKPRKTIIDDNDYYKISMPLSEYTAKLTIPNEMLHDKVKIQLLKNLINANLDVFLNN